ncbi:MAG: hypothetical protein COV52_00060 [Gammaproteobacteria bacterium CG11_big_fil_rev_8_21_14_0_20_46_22]|nr:MAG: hypothetical protein COV52_00060 [Gammaproteobacteria bacterium CG11_big_fil_rev_8_21_14_0_20_46_22]
MKVGVDCGSTLTKFYWREGGEDRFTSTADRSLPQILERLRRAGVVNLAITGNGKHLLPHAIGFGLSWPKQHEAADDVSRELDLQVVGARHLLGVPEDMILVSVGSGTSYTLLRAEGQGEQLCIGNPLGGGHIYGLACLLGEPDAKIINRKSRLDDTTLRGVVAGKRPYDYDLSLGELLGLDATDLRYRFVASHFTKADPGYRQGKKLDRGAVYRTIMNEVVIAIVRDLMVQYTIRPDLPKLVVYLGSTVTRFEYLQQVFALYTPFVTLESADQTPVEVTFPPRGEYAGAIGAYLSH